MKIVINITALLAVLALAVIGCLAIFEVLSYAEAREFLFKAEAAIVLLGGCALVVGFLLGKGKSGE